MSMKPRVLKKAVTAAGTRERITTADIEAPSVVIQALTGNTGVVYVGDNQVSATNGIELDQGESVSMGATAKGWDNEGVSMKDVWLDVATSADGVTVMYLEKA